MSGAVTYITLRATNIESAAAFYETVFQWPPGRSVPHARFFEFANLTIALMESGAFAKFTGAETTGPNTTGTLCSWNVGNREAVDELVQRAVEAGATVSRAAARLDWGGWAAIIRTSDGYLWEIVWNPKRD
jgi:predicted lactoylglutathione lyase